LQSARNDFLGLLVKRGNNSYNYEISDEYSQAISGFAGDYEYFGYVTTTGYWIIQQHQISNGQYRYAQGTTGYAALVPFASNLSALGLISYGLYNTIFA
jgi:hypothetical protein